MQNIGILVNTNKDKDLLITQNVCNILKNVNINPILFGTVAEKLGYPVISRNTFLKRIECIFVLGGDGTMLGAVADAAKLNIPVMGINLGKIGFLTEIEINEIEYAAKKIADNDFKILERMMLQCDIAGKEIFALNEIAIHRASYERVAKILIETEDKVVDKFFADGVIIATPTGSTAYSLSAGGPILTPSLSAIVLTPICAHTLRTRPIIFSDNEILKVSIISPTDVSIAYDGTEILLKDQSMISIKKARISAKFIVLKDKNFYKLLNTKLNEWSVSEEDSK